MIKREENNGAAAIITLLVVSMVALAASVSISFLGISDAKTSLAFNRNAETVVAAKGCAEEALLKLRNDASYSGENLTLDETNCIIDISDSGGNKIISVEATIVGPPSYNSRLQIEAARAHRSINIINYNYTQ